MANIKDIAELAGVSIATVSRTLREPHKVKPATSKKVNEAIEKLSYKTNLVASSLRKQKADAVIVAVPDLHNSFVAGLVQGVENVARENGIKVMLGVTEGKQELLDRHYEMVAGKQADGMIVLDVNTPSAIINNTSGKPLPIVLTCEYEAILLCPRVRFDNIEVAAEAVSYLVSLDHKNVAYISGSRTLRMSRDRQSGFRLGLRRAGLTVNENIIAGGDYRIETGVEATQALIESGEKFTAIVCESDEIALGAIHTLAEAGLQVPEDISVLGMDNIRFAQYGNPPLTTIALKSSQVGEQAMRLLLDYYLDAEAANREIILPHQLIERKSTAQLLSGK
ncbi:LacI family DNA-binding transcriptional regulator [Halioxenophilus aromaticivorans]|uniref:DNA-binding transcriptional regulator CytR n=1 Tax=Halioxenophilus aromaticivorans TaxID=1306992 RepID=A0AAV3U3D9_9ALTE